MARSFDASTDKVNFGDTGVFDGLSKCTWAGWVYLDSVANTATGRRWWSQWGSSSANLAWVISQEDNEGDSLVVAVGNGSNISAYSARNCLSASAWMHICAVWSGTTNWTVYKNGSAQSLTELVGTPVSGIVNGSASETFGESSPGENGLLGKIADWCAWSVALSADEVTGLSRGVNPRRIRPVSIIRHTDFYGNASPECDRVGVAATGTVTGTSYYEHPSVGRPFDGANWWPGAFTASGAAATTPKLIGGNLIRPNLVRGRLAA